MTTLITLVTIIHIISALALIGLVLVQDTKSGGALGIGGPANSNSILGATGAQTLAAKLTASVTIMFAITSLSLAYFASRQNASVVDQVQVPQPQQSAPALPATPPAANDVTPEKK